MTQLNPNQNPDTPDTSIHKGDTAASEGPTVYFDGSCPLCAVEIGHYASRSGARQITFIDVSQGITDLGADLQPADAMSRFHVRLSNGTLVSGARAFVEVWQILPGWRWVARVARLPGIIVVLEVSYRLILPVRPMLAALVKRLGIKDPSGSKQ